jgi:hypothetical protein
VRSAFVRSMLFEGRLRIGKEPSLALTDEDLATLKSALAIETLHLPGPRLHGSLPTLVHAVQVMYRLAWRFFNHDPVGPADDPTLRMPAPPQTPEEHAGGDVAFRFLPGLYKRAMSRDAAGPLALAMKNLLRQWPLSGVLADVTEAPEMPIDFAGHVGLGYLFAQRLAVNERSCWLPSGPARDCVEVVYHAMGRSLVESPPRS